MFLRKKLNEMDEDVTQSLKNVGQDIQNVWRRLDNWARQHQTLRNDFDELRDELATNGVVRDLRKLQKEVVELREFKAGIEQNGVATHINRLNAEVFKTRKVKKDTGIFSSRLMSQMFGLPETEPAEEATLAGKVDAIVAHLGLDVTVAPKEVKEAKVVAKKVAAPKKKGRR